MSVDTETLNSETYEILLKEGRRLADAQATSPKYDSRLASAIQQHGRAVAMFSSEKRKADKMAEQEDAKLTQEQRADAAVEWLARLPPELLRPIIERLRSALRKRA